MNAKAAQKARTHEGILESASRLLRASGISGSPVADVMKGVGLTVGGFYSHFDSKEALVREVLRRASAQLRDRLFSRLDEKPAEDRAVVALSRYLSDAHRDAATPNCPLPAVVGEIGTKAPEYGSVLGEQIQALATTLQTHLRPSRHHIALALVALMYGGLSLARAVAGTRLSDEILEACRCVGEQAIRT